MDGWGREAAERLKKRMANKIQSDAVLLEKRKLLEEQGPVLWMSVREHVTQMVNDLNNEYGEMVASISPGDFAQLHVKLTIAGTMTEFRARFVVSTSAEALTWSYSGPAKAPLGSVKYELLSKDGKVVFQQGMVLSTPEAVAHKMMDGLLGD